MAILGLSMIVLGILLLLFALGMLTWYYWPRPASGTGPGRAASGAALDSQPEDNLL